MIEITYFSFIELLGLRNLQFLFMPHYWHMNYSYNKEVDDIINDLLDKYEFTNLQYKCVSDLGPYKIWVGNRPYAAITLYETPFENYRPSRLTIKRALKKFDKYVKN